jgi:hypothetical protein
MIYFYLKVYKISLSKYIIKIPDLKNRFLKFIWLCCKVWLLITKSSRATSYYYY